MFSLARPISLFLVGRPSSIPQARRHGTARWGGVLCRLVLHLRLVPLGSGDFGQFALCLLAPAPLVHSSATPLSSLATVGGCFLSLFLQWVPSRCVRRWGHRRQGQVCRCWLVLVPAVGWAHLPFAHPGCGGTSLFSLAPLLGMSLDVSTPLSYPNAGSFPPAQPFIDIWGWLGGPTGSPGLHDHLVGRWCLHML